MIEYWLKARCRPWVLLLVTLSMGSRLWGQADDEPVAGSGLNYAYSAVLGAGIYTTASGRVLVGSLPLSWGLAPLNERNRIRLLFPFTAGVADIVNTEGEFEFPDQVLTASFMPGIAWEHYARENWMLVPTLQVGAAKDFQADTTAWLYSAAVRSYAWWDIGKYRLGLGNRLLGAGQYIDETDAQTGFVLLESGLEGDYLLPWSIGTYSLSASVYALWQRYLDDVNIDAVSGEQISVTNMFYLGVTFGFRKSVTILRFIPIHRVGVSIGRGNSVGGADIRSVTFNLGFPLSYD